MNKSTLLAGLLVSASVLISVSANAAVSVQLGGVDGLGQVHGDAKLGAPCLIAVVTRRAQHHHGGTPERRSLGDFSRDCAAWRGRR